MKVSDVTIGGISKRVRLDAYATVLHGPGFLVDADHH